MEKGDFISTAFTRNKNGGMHTTLNFKQLNKLVRYQHFKLESVLDVFKIIQPNSWMASANLKNFYTIPIHNSCQQYFKFMWYQKF